MRLAIINDYRELAEKQPNGKNYRRTSRSMSIKTGRPTPTKRLAPYVLE